MSSNCLVCGLSADIQPSIPQIIDTFRVVLKVLETQALKLENENAEKLRKLNFQLNEVTAQSRALEGDKINAEKRSDTYKKRFLDAQKAIQQLHEKNVQLSSQKIQNTSSIDKLRNFPFASQKLRNEFSPETKKAILAPDTCAQEAEPHQDDITFITSDEDDFKQECKQSKSRSQRRSPTQHVLKTPTKSIVESFFAKPKSPPKSWKKRRLATDTPKSYSDLDETRLDSCNPMDTSITFEPSELAKLDEEMDSIPPSPILSGGKERRFGVFRGSRGSIPKYNDYAEKENSSPSRFNTKRESSNPITVKISNPAGEKDSLKQSANLGLHEGHTILEANPGNTSLDELFDKTYGDLETTTMLGNSTFEMKDEEEQSDDEDLDALLLEGIGDDELNTSANNGGASSRIKTENRCPVLDPKPAKLMWDNSFDVLPKKTAEKNFKYQEVVRKHHEREKLDAKACAQCEAYYSDVPEDERREVMRKACRHKHVHAPPSTPEHFWEIGIPNTEECKRRGYITDEKDLPFQQREDAPRFRRKKPLEPFFSKKR